MLIANGGMAFTQTQRLAITDETAVAAHRRRLVALCHGFDPAASGRHGDDAGARLTKSETYPIASCPKLLRFAGPLICIISSFSFSRLWKESQVSMGR